MLRQIKLKTMNASERLTYFKDIISVDDFQEIEHARGMVKQEDILPLIEFYSSLNDWNPKRAWVELVQDWDETDKSFGPPMLDYVQAPYYPAGKLDVINMAKAIALCFVANSFDQYDALRGNNEMLKEEVLKTLAANDLTLVPNPE